MVMLNKDMTLCISLSARPSNNGTRFHNHLYESLGRTWIYQAFAPTNLADAIVGVLGSSAAAIASVNTVASGIREQIAEEAS